jgi:hypothetical protein
MAHPRLEPNTVLLTHQMPIDYETDNSFTAPINWMYAPEYTRADLPYMLLYTEKRIGGATLPALEKGIHHLPLPHGGFPQFHLASRRHLHAAQRMPARARPQSRRCKSPTRANPTFPDSSHPAFGSHRALFQIRINPPTDVLPEPEHEWCYFFTKAELAQQQGDYEQVVALGDEAMSKLGYTRRTRMSGWSSSKSYALTGELQNRRRPVPRDVRNRTPEPAAGCAMFGSRFRQKVPKEAGMKSNLQSCRSIAIHNVSA